MRDTEAMKKCPLLVRTKVIVVMVSLELQKNTCGEDDSH